MNKIPHADVMRAFLDGKEVQKAADSNAKITTWITYVPNTMSNLPWMHPQDKWRIKPVKRTPYQVYMDALIPNTAPHHAALPSQLANRAWQAVVDAAKAGEFDNN